MCKSFAVGMLFGFLIGAAFFACSRQAPVPPPAPRAERPPGVPADALRREFNGEPYYIIPIG